MSKEKTKLMKLIVKYRDAFSLRDEIGACPNLTADIQVIDESSFFVRPFPLSEPDKVFMDEKWKDWYHWEYCRKIAQATHHQLCS